MRKSSNYVVKISFGPQSINSGLTGLGSSVGRVCAMRSGGTGFDPGPRHTKIINTGTSCSALGFSG